MAKIDNGTDRRIYGIGIISVASFIWLGVCAWLFMISTPCNPNAAGFLNSKVRCLAANEMGDFLAGAFVPLAFLWLIAAVLLQRSELAAQRQELIDSRLVATQQVEEARKNVSFIEAQTKILEAGRKLSEVKEYDLQFLEMVDIFNRSFRWCEGRFSVWEVTPSKAEMIKSMDSFDIDFSLDADSVELAKKNVYSIYGLHAGLVVFRLEDTKFKYRGLEHLNIAFGLLYSLAEKSKHVSEPLAAKATYIGIDVGAAEAREILDVLREHAEVADWRDVPSRPPRAV